MVRISRGSGELCAGCSKRPSSKAAASEGPEAYPLGYVEGLNDARTPLAVFFSILLVEREAGGLMISPPASLF